MLFPNLKLEFFRLISVDDFFVKEIIDYNDNEKIQLKFKCVSYNKYYNAMDKYLQVKSINI